MQTPCAEDGKKVRAKITGRKKTTKSGLRHNTFSEEKNDKKQKCIFTAPTTCAVGGKIYAQKLLGRIKNVKKTVMRYRARHNKRNKKQNIHSRKIV